VPIHVNCVVTAPLEVEDMNQHVKKLVGRLTAAQRALPMRHRLPAALVVAVSLIVAACGDDDDDGGAARTAVETPESAQTAPTEPSPSTGSAAPTTPPPPATAPTSQPETTTTSEPTDVSVDDGETVIAERFRGRNFYAVPDPLPEGEPGTLLRYQPIEEFGGWRNFGDAPDEFGLEILGTASGGISLFRDVLAVRPDRTDRPEPDESVGSSAEELATWVAEHPDLDASDPEPVSFGGLDGYSVDIAIAAGSTNSPVFCPPEEVCVDLFSPPHLEWAWRLVTHDDVARVILLSTADGAGTVVVTVDPYDFTGADREAFYESAAPVLESLDFTGADTRTEPPGGECVNGFGSCRGDLQPGTYASTEFQPAVTYTVPEPATDQGATAWRMMYLSESIQGEPIAVTGTALVPSTAAPEDGRPILSVAHGTTGIADECAPSHNPNWDLAEQTPYVNEGYLVAFTDYEGLGTPGRHPYIVGESEGRGVLDAAKAARQLPAADAGDRLAIWGHSQGGHAAMWAAQLAADWAPELDLIGTIAAGTPADLTAVGEAITEGPEKGSVFMTIAGYAAAYTDLDLSWALTPAGEKQLDVVDEGCADDVLAHFADADANRLLKPLGSVDAWTDILEANNPGQTFVDSPILLVHGTEDYLPYAAVERMHERMCANGQDVELWTIEGGDHDASYEKAGADGFDWIQQRLAGEETASTCGE
jgi:pimeloyl-ACP methyl ester carboxylesterase